MVAPPDNRYVRRVACILGLPVDIIDTDEAVARVRSAARTGTRLFLSTPNLNFAIAALSDEAFRDSVLESDLSVADGISLLWVGRLLGVPFPERVAGSTLLERLRAGPGEDPIRVYFFGGEEGVAEAAAARVNAEPCGIRCVGWQSPGFGTVQEMSAPERIARINESGAQFLIVALGARKGQAWIRRNLDDLAVPVVSHLGAALNFVAGRLDRAPPALQSLGLEWLWRIKEEPQLWSRYFRDGLALARLVVLRVLPLARLSSSSASARPTPSIHHDPDGDVRVSLGGMSHLSPDQVGDLLLVFGRQRRLRRKLRIDGLAPQTRRVIALSCAEFLLGDGQAGAEREPGEAKVPT